jgi:hypothetical protein
MLSCQGRLYFLLTADSSLHFQRARIDRALVLIVLEELIQHPTPRTVHDMTLSQMCPTSVRNKETTNKYFCDVWLQPV